MPKLEELASRVRLHQLQAQADRTVAAASGLAALDEASVRLRYDAAKRDASAERLPAVAEMIRRHIGIALYPEQHVAALALAKGLMTEMKTGEGKTLVALAAAAMLAKDDPVHVVTVNDYLARVGYEQAMPVLTALGLRAALNTDSANKPEVYAADVVFTSSQELIFDYLRNELRPEAQRHVFPLAQAILDEVDFVLLDNANSEFSIGVGMPTPPDTTLHRLAREIADTLRGQEAGRDDEGELEDPEDADYVYRAYDRAAYLTTRGVKKLEQILQTEDLLHHHFRFYQVLMATLEARLFYQRGRDYVVQDGRVVLVNRENGRLMPTSQREPDVQTALEVHEDVQVQPTPLHSYSLSYQMFFAKYAHLVGMSGTVWEAQREFQTLFRKQTVLVPPHRKNRRKDLPDLAFLTREAEYRYLAHFIRDLNLQQQPVLVIAQGEGEAADVTQRLRDAGVAAVHLTATSPTEEAALVARAGETGRVTVSTNMAGRGTDILLSKAAAARGGLLVIVLGHFMSLRVDNQARGRAGRQGQPGACFFLTSLEDEIWQVADAPWERILADTAQGAADPFAPLSKQTNRELSKMSAALQTEVQAVQESQRKLKFQLDMVLERQWQMVQVWKEELLAANPAALFGQTVAKPNFPLEKLVALVGDAAGDWGITGLAAALERQMQRLGPDLATNLFHALVPLLVSREWPLYKRDLRDLRAYLSLQGLIEEQQVTRYVHLCFEELAHFKENLLLGLLAHFLLAEQQR